MQINLQDIKQQRTHTHMTSNCVFRTSKHLFQSLLMAFRHQKPLHVLTTETQQVHMHLARHPRKQNAFSILCIGSSRCRIFLFVFEKLLQNQIKSNERFFVVLSKCVFLIATARWHSKGCGIRLVLMSMLTDNHDWRHRAAVLSAGFVINRYKIVVWLMTLLSNLFIYSNHDWSTFAFSSEQTKESHSKFVCVAVVQRAPFRLVGLISVHLHLQVKSCIQISTIKTDHRSNEAWKRKTSRAQIVPFVANRPRTL